MLKKNYSLLLFLTCIFSSAFIPTSAKTVVFYEKDFPAIENGSISRESLERALASLKPHFIDLNGLAKDSTLQENDLLVLPYGSAIPQEAWETLYRYLDKGNLLIIGGRPFTIPVRRDGKIWRIDNPQNTYSRYLDIDYAYAAPQNGPWTLQWHEDAPWFHITELNPIRVFVNAGRGGRYRGLGYLVNSLGDRIAAPVVAEDLIEFSHPPRRRVYLSFEADSMYWESKNGIELIRQAAIYASRGGVRLWLDIQQLTLEPGGHITGAVDVVQSERPSKLTLELLAGSKVLASRSTICNKTLHEEIGLSLPLSEPGLYRLRASLSIGDTVFEQYTSGVVVRNSTLLHSGQRLETGRDYFRLDEKPYLMVGVNYFSTDLYTSGFFVGSSIGGNPWVWEKDFAEMERLGFTAVRTGIWLNRIRYLDPISGSADERLLRAIEAYLHAAARHHLQVIFTFFAFDPQTEMQQGRGQEGSRLGPGSNPYIDPIAIEAQTAYVSAIASRFKNVPFLSFDLINEPSFNNPKRLWKGNSPNGDSKELAAWQHWLEQSYKTIDKLAEAWRSPSSELGAFSKVPLPSFADLEIARSGNQKTVRAVDYNHFAQDAFSGWVNAIIQAIRTAGANQAITVGQDEGGVADRVLNQFWGETEVNYTVNHSWWRDDALLWNSVTAKTLNKPNLIGETGPQPVWSMDGRWRWDEIQGLPLLERKLALGFANANTGVLYWDWTHSDTYGLLRRDGSYKQWMDVLRGIATFAHDAQEYATEAKLPDIALILPQSLQLSAFSSWGIEVQQKSIRALYQYARASAFAIGEYQLAQMPEARLIIVPAPWVFSQEAWDILMNKVKSGATLLISGRIDADEHWLPVPDRTRDWNLDYSSQALITRDVELRWPAGTAHMTFSGDKTTYAERGVLPDDKTFIDIPLGKGRILYFALPLELADQLDAIGEVYKYAMSRAGVKAAFETSSTDPGILICPTELPDATLYVIASESASESPIVFKDALSGKDFTTVLSPGRAALMLINKNGHIIASYNITSIDK